MTYKYLKTPYSSGEINDTIQSDIFSYCAFRWGGLQTSQCAHDTRDASRDNQWNGAQVWEFKGGTELHMPFSCIITYCGEHVWWQNCQFLPAVDEEDWCDQRVFCHRSLKKHTIIMLLNCVWIAI